MSSKIFPPWLKVADVWAAKLPFSTMRQITWFNHLVVGHLSVMEPVEAANDDWLLRWQKLWSFESISRLQIVVLYWLLPKYLTVNSSSECLTHQKIEIVLFWPGKQIFNICPNIICTAFVALEHVYALDRGRREARTYMKARTWTHKTWKEVDCRPIGMNGRGFSVF